jgi:pyruvate/2-oxoacid:ferredoxin oxidoreductase beta subunit
MGINLAEHYLNRKQLPHIWCAGCGNGIVLGALTRALADLGLDKRNVVVVTGIGCWGKADDYLTTNAFHGTHGRALAFATGIKAAKNPTFHSSGSTIRSTPRSPSIIAPTLDSLSCLFSLSSIASCIIAIFNPYPPSHRPA